MLIKVLIVEDEMIVRVGIKSMIAWNEIGYELVGEAVNGVHALELVELYKPDVVITDIQMPEMNGIELMKRLRDCQEDVQVIILSCHNEFEYVQQALKLGAVDYILKLSMKPEELTDILGRLRDNRMKQMEEKYRSEQRLHISAEAMRKQLVLGMLEGKLVSEEKWNEEVRNWSIPLSARTGVMVCRVKERQEENGLFKRKELLLFSVTNVVHEIVKAEFGGEVTELDSNEIVMLANCDNAVMWQKKSRIVAQKIGDALRQYLKLSVTIGIAPQLCKLPDAAETLKAARAALDHAIFYNKDVTVAGTSQTASREELVELTRTAIREIELELKASHTAGLQHIVKVFMGQLRLVQAASVEVRSMLEELLLPFYRLSVPAQDPNVELPRWKRDSPEEAIRTSETIYRLEAWFLSWIEAYMDSASFKNERVRTEVAQARSHIHRNYKQKITVADIAGAIGLSESYLSHLYKKETGENLIDYMTKYRLEKAKRLLSETDLRTYEIAESIGFSEANYFSKQFKRYEGINPLEYRNQFSKNNAKKSKNNTE
jgi:two-component system response regulator YesN